ncbi:MAG TPA: DUF4893 domain-containing protein [Sphingomonas sp.]|nr:DUF4893 domain-containing protein [Sphingomonas sp.]
MSATVRRIACGLLLAIGVPAAAAPSLDWRKVATQDDRARLRGWRGAWMDAVAAIRRAGQGGRLAADPALFDADRSLADASLPAGRYRCRSYRLGAARAEFIVRDWVDCRVSTDGVAAQFETTGMTRVAGRLFAHTDARKIFLGTLALGDEPRPMRYGRDTRRNMAGVVERIGARRWRIALPYPGLGATLDLIEVDGR